VFRPAGLSGATQRQPQRRRCFGAGVGGAAAIKRRQSPRFIGINTLLLTKGTLDFFKEENMLSGDKDSSRKFPTYL